MIRKLLRTYLLPAILLFIISIVVADCSYADDQEYSIHINRKDGKFFVIRNSNKKIIYIAPCGVGRGGLRTKKRMSDFITPTGEFVVDLILYRDDRRNVVAPVNIDRFKGNKKYSQLVSSRKGLAKLFKNMNSIDFNRDGAPDRAYGIGYIGLESDNAVTGSKLKMHGGTPYWYSIAIHGTPDQANVGRANSGGCVHLKAKDITWLMDNNVVDIGTKVTISDGDPE